tara:strand:- start:203 stop:598 length:396 start_codon:yes stop_codon:yes gene_type:complete
MIKFFSNYKVIFYLANFFLIFLYLFPGSLFGMIVYGDKSTQPQITPDFMISSNHFYVFILISIIGFLTFIKLNQVKILIIYLILLSIILEVTHLILPDRSFQWSDLFGNLLGVFIVIFSKKLINKYVLFKE